MGRGVRKARLRDPEPWEVERVFAAASRCAAMGIHPSREAVHAAARMSFDAIAICRDALQADGRWTWGRSSWESRLASPSPDDLKALASDMGSEPTRTPPPDALRRRREFAYRGGSTPRDAIPPEELRERARAERAWTEALMAEPPPKPPPRTPSEWCRLYLKDWRRRTGRLRPRPKALPGDAA